MITPISELRELAGVSRAEGAVSNLSEYSGAFTLGGGGAGSRSLMKRNSNPSMARVDGIVPMSSERIKALEIAYLTKLAPKTNKPP